MLITQWLHCFWHSKTTPLLQGTSWVAAFVRSLLAEGHVVPLGFFIYNLPVPWEAKDQPALGKEALNIVKKTGFDMATFIQPSVRTRVLWHDPDHITHEQLQKQSGILPGYLYTHGQGWPWDALENALLVLSLECRRSLSSSEPQDQ